MEPTLILYDLDGTLIDSDHHIHNTFMAFLHQQVGRHLPNLTWEEFLQENAPYYTLHGSSIVGWQKRLELDDDWAHSLFREAAPHLAQPVIDAIQPDDAILTELEWQRAQGHTLAILTHSYETYAVDVMEHARLFEVIPRENLFGMGRVKSLKTDTDGKAYLHVLTELDARGMPRIMVENIAANLAPAKTKLFTTMLTNNPGPDQTHPETLPDYVDFHHTTIHQTQQSIRAQLTV